MRVFAISDLHLSINNPKPMDIFGSKWDDYIDKIVYDWGKKIADEDVVLIAGDISWAMHLEDAMLDLDFIGKLKGKKIMIRGNHDYWWKSITVLRNVLPKDFYALQNDCLKFGDIIFCGSRGWMVDSIKDEDKKIFDRELIRIKLSLEQMQKIKEEGDRIVLMLHYPPFNYKGENSKVTELIEEYNVDKVVYGHLHGNKIKTPLNLKKGKTEYYLTSCDQINNELVEIII
ncbi:MAG: metallophosphoesterase [Firmicutes bacterium]|nr:metallophosphoesterase [Bacillota bacterium]